MRKPSKIQSQFLLPRWWNRFCCPRTDEMAGEWHEPLIYTQIISKHHMLQLSAALLLIYSLIYISDIDYLKMWVSVIEKKTLLLFPLNRESRTSSQFSKKFWTKAKYLLAELNCVLLVSGQEWQILELECHTPGRPLTLLIDPGGCSRFSVSVDSLGREEGLQSWCSS